MSAHYGQIEWIKYDELRLATNPRSLESISQEAIRELGESILERGVTDPVRARISPDGKIEIWDGQRRFLAFAWAVELAGQGKHTTIDLSTMPVINDGEMTDGEMLERQMHGFVQREELTPLDEAKGFARLRDEFGRSEAEISRSISRGLSFVTHRLGLLRVPERAWKAYSAHRLTLKHLELIGAVPLASDREQFTKQILAGPDGLPLTVKQAQELRDSEYGVELQRTIFDRDDPKLVPIQWKDDERVGGGACNAECPFYGGSDKRPMCGNVRCYQAKQLAAWHVIKGNAINNNKRWMDIDASSHLFTKGTKLELDEECEFIDLAARLGFKDTGNYDPKHPVWGDLLEDTDALKKAVTTLHPHGRKVYQLLERETAITLAVERDPTLEALFAKRPGAVKKVQAVETVESAPVPPVRSEKDDQDDHAADDGAVADGFDDEHTVEDATCRRAAMEHEAAQLRAFWKRATAGGDIDELLREVLRTSTWQLTTDNLRVVLAGSEIASMDQSGEWPRDALVSALLDSQQEAEPKLLLVLLTQYSHRGYMPIMRMMQEMLEADEQADVEGEDKPSTETAGNHSDDAEEASTGVLSDRERAWFAFAKGSGKGTIAKQLGISENTVGNWQKRDWPSREDLKRYQDANGTSVPLDMSLKAVNAWLAAN